VDNLVENSDETVENAVENLVNKSAKIRQKVFHQIRRLIHRKFRVFHNFSTASALSQTPHFQRVRAAEGTFSTVSTAHHVHHYFIPFLFIKKKSFILFL